MCGSCQHAILPQPPTFPADVALTLSLMFPFTLFLACLVGGPFVEGKLGPMRVHPLPRSRAPLALLSNVFGSHQVFQTGSPVTLWGFIPSGTLVNVTMVGAASSNTVSVTAFPNNTWYASLPAINTPGGPYTILVAASNGANATLTDVLVGTVLICSGQSNLSGATTPVAYTFNASGTEAEGGDMPWVRLFTVGEQAITGLQPPQAQLPYPPFIPWSVATPTTVASFSGTCFVTAKVIARTMGPSHPLALIETAWSGTCIQAWLPSEALAACGPVPAAQGWQTNSTLYNQMVAPFAHSVGGGMGISAAGVVFYQGESNAIFWGGDAYYGCALTQLFSSWRSTFNNPTAWFGIVQLAPWSGTPGANVAGVRAAQLTVTLSDPRATLGSAVDLGDASAPKGNIHPRPKQALGARLAAGALHHIFGVPSTTPLFGPVYAQAKPTSPKPPSTAPLAASITFAPPYATPASLVINTNATAWPGLAPSSVCPSIPGVQCAGFELQDGSAGGGGKWYPATAVYLNGDASAVIVEAGGAPVGAVLNGTSLGFAVWPLISLFGAAGGLPAHPWRAFLN